VTIRFTKRTLFHVVSSPPSQSVSMSVCSVSSISTMYIINWEETGTTIANPAFVHSNVTKWEERDDTKLVVNDTCFDLYISKSRNNPQRYSNVPLCFQKLYV
jgi:hypothetical protein